MVERLQRRYEAAAVEAGIGEQGQPALGQIW